MEIKNFKYSLIIPTRNRQSTAISAIESGVNCNYPDLEIIVTDNSDDSSLKEILDERGLLPKVIYSKTTSVLSMRDNWERGVELSSGEYLSIIGDDDAVLPDAFLRANTVFSNYDIEVLKSAYAIYKWPDYPFHGMRNFLEIPIDDGFRIVNDPRKLLLDAIQYKHHVGTGPGIYYGFVKRKFLESLKKIRGRYFVDVVPDFDSGYATMMYAKSYIYSNRIMFVQGHSGSSNSGAMRSIASSNNAMERFEQESYGSKGMVFTSALHAIRTNRSMIISAQIRTLPEIRNVLKDRSVSVDYRGAWDYLADEIAQGYDGVEFPQQLKQLAQLASEWGINDSIKLPTKKHLGWGILYEQGPRLNIGNLNTKARISQEKEPNKLVVNGNKLHLNDILGAVRYVDATLSQLVRFENTDVLNYANKLIKERSANNIKLAEVLLAQKKFADAEKILDNALAEDSRNPILLALVGKIYFEERRYLEGANTWGRALTFLPNSEYLKNYLTCLVRLGRSVDASKYLEFCREQNPEHATFLSNLEQEILQEF